MPEQIADKGGVVPYTKAVRMDLDAFEKQLREFKNYIASPANPLPENADRGEMIANATLALRHVEDARMRMGKVIQYHDGGVSIYDAAPEKK